VDKEFLRLIKYQLRIYYEKNVVLSLASIQEKSIE